MMKGSQKALQHLETMHDLLSLPNATPPENTRQELARIAVSAQDYVEDTRVELESYRQETKRLQTDIGKKAEVILEHLQNASRLHESTLQTKVDELTEAQQAISEHASQYQHVYDKLNPFFKQPISTSTSNPPQPQK